ncbi:hypothetical protein OJ996_25675 [Luteolibacter sp. GHJ8]|uniref:Uncharacterized protein n=1 Tax=Luteolibacter rhizosphaerae TaxID=2989719 RepID=A0ABT3GAZ8_9BACT|nr:hypothetical protein [Luteolibacter rhizosphaerae]MCW1917005.1 hypothetical protein [Luteolibacter rhizosphaerae]
MPRPWHRSPLFYLGLFPLLFLLWAWWDSNHHSTTFMKVRGSTSLVHLQVITHSRGALRITDQKVEVIHASISTGTDFGRSSVASEERLWCPAPHLEIARQTTSETADYQPEIITESHLTLPHWLLILAYLALWSLLLFWRSRRIKRLSRLKISA